jgi:hypothetical protein
VIVVISDDGFVTQAKVLMVCTRELDGKFVFCLFVCLFVCLSGK